MRKLEQYYRNYIPGAQIATEYGVSAEHALITDHYGRACAYLGDPFINNCNYDGAGTLLQWLQKSPLKSRVNATRANVRPRAINSTVTDLRLTGVRHQPGRVHSLQSGPWRHLACQHGLCLRATCLSQCRSVQI